MIDFVMAYSSYLLIVVGFVLLMTGANWLVNGASGLAKRFHVPDLVIGLTIVAFGTSAPELVVNLVAACTGSSEIALTNILGSNIINTLVILGVAGVICPVTSQTSSRHFDIPLSIWAGFAVLLLALVTPENGGVNRLGGIFLLIFFCLFMWVMVRKAIRGDGMDENEGFKAMKAWKAVLMVVVGLVALVFGGNLIVESAKKIAMDWGVSEYVIGLTIVALGTSLPELATSAVAAFKGNSDLAIGNVIGSNIFNVFFVLGISSTISPLPAYDGLVIDALMAGGSSLLLLGFVSTNKEHKLLRWQAIIFLLIYAVYLYTRL